MSANAAYYPYVAQPEVFESARPSPGLLNLDTIGYWH